MRPHQAFPELSVVRYGEVEEFVNDHIVPEILVQVEKFKVEVHVAVCGARGPLVAHRANAEPDDFHVQFFRPAIHATFEDLFSLGGFHCGEIRSAFSSNLNNSLTMAATLVGSSSTSA